jgi:uncharacterized membrane protein YjfL (UPF0719 family)
MIFKLYAALFLLVVAGLVALVVGEVYLLVTTHNPWHLILAGLVVYAATKLLRLTRYLNRQ